MNNFEEELEETEPASSIKEKEPVLSVEEFIEDLGSRQQGTHMRKYSRCKICSKECRSDNIRAHVKNSHPDTLGIKKASKMKIDLPLNDETEDVEID